jgi:general secretion pathway protein D
LKSDHWKAAVLVLAMAAIAGCGGGKAFSKAEAAARAGDWDTAVTYYTQAVEADPASAEYKIALERAQLGASRQHLEKAQSLENKGDLEGAIVEYRKASEFDPANRRAATKALQLTQNLRERMEEARPKPQFDQMKERARQAAEPMLNPSSRQPLKFSFAQGIDTKQILDFLAQASGINVMYDSTTTTQATKSKIDLDDVTLEQALNLVLSSNGLFYKILNPKTILVIQDNATNRGKYDEQVIQTFYLNHADPGEMQSMLNAILAQRTGGGVPPQIQQNKTGNSLTIRAAASIVAIAERIIANNDKPRAEIVIDVEILEVNRTKAKSYGLNLSNYAVGLQFSPEAPPSGTGGAPGTGTSGATQTAASTFNLNSISRGINTSDFYLTVPSAVVKFLESDSNTKLIAKPSLRGQEGKKLSAHLGDDIPVPSTTFQPIVGGGTGISPMTSFNYRQVGVNVDVTPRVTYDGDIILDLEVESSTKGSDVNVAGQNLPSFGSRKVITTMRLRDGESNLLAGLLRDDERRSLNGFPGAIHVPVLKQLFSANDSQISQTDIVMLLTPHIIRTQGITEKDMQPIYIGSGANPSLGGAPPLIAPVGGDAAAAQGPPQAAVPAQPAPPITTLPYGAPGAALVGGAPLAAPTPQGTPVVPPGSTPIPGTVMMPPQAPPAGQPALPAGAAPPPAAQPTLPAGAAPPTAAQPAQPAAGTPPAGAAPTAAASTPAQVLITTPGTDWRVGAGPYTVTLSAANVTRVTTITLTIMYNPAAVKIRSLQEGGFMRQGVPNTAFVHQEDTAAGRIDFTISRSDPVGASGSGPLAAVVFDAVAPGAASFRVSGVANGPAGPIVLQFMPATVTVK